jgi:hypothetical protein
MPTMGPFENRRDCNTVELSRGVQPRSMGAGPNKPSPGLPFADSGKAAGAGLTFGLV